jgi:hypothetical protein
MTRSPRLSWFSQQPTLSSQLIDNLNVSIHVRALLTDLFLLREVANIQRRAAKPMASGG